MSPLTIEALAGARGLDPGTLRKLGWQETAEGIAIPWPVSRGEPARHIRRALERVPDGRRWSWRGYDRQRLLPYLSPFLDKWRSQGATSVAIVESEADAVALAQSKIPAIATAGADSWQPGWWELLRGFERAVLWIEDAGTLPLLRNLVATQPQGPQEPQEWPRLCVCHSLGGPAKDAGRLLAVLNGSGADVLRRLVGRARPVEQVGELLPAVVERRQTKGAQDKATRPGAPSMMTTRPA